MMNRACLLLLAVPAFGLFAACSSTPSGSGVGTGVDASAADGGEEGAVADAAGGGTQCTKARDDLLLPVEKTATGDVSVVRDTGGTKIIYVDASAGGLGGASLKNPRVYIDLATGTKVALGDRAAVTSTAWDLALKRAVIFTNGGDAGIGLGGAVQLNKSFASVTADTASATPVEKETFFDEECNPKLDPTGAPDTTFSDWYDYDQVTNVPTPKNVTYVVVGGTGKKYKVGIKSYSGAPDGGTGTTTGAFVLEVTAL